MDAGEQSKSEWSDFGVVERACVHVDEWMSRHDLDVELVWTWILPFGVAVMWTTDNLHFVALS